MAIATLYRNGRLHAPSVPAATALVVEGDRIAWVGSEVGCQQFEQLPTVDLAGHWLAPGFVDGHVHLADTGWALQADLVDARSRAELAALLRALSPQERLLMAHGWDDSGWSEAPDWNDLPQELPVYASRIDLHTALVNQALLALAPEIAQTTGWNAGGLVRGEAHELARRTALGLCSPSERLRQAQRALQLFAANGVVAVHEMAGPVVSGRTETEQLLAWLPTADTHPEVCLWWGEADGGVTAAELSAFGAGGDLFIDGSLGSRTAALTQDYADFASRGIRYLDEAQLRRHLLHAARAGRRTSFHAIGDQALTDLISAWEWTAGEIGTASFAAQQHQVEHAMLLDRLQIQRLAALNIAVSAQPQFDRRWGGANGMYAQRLGPDRASATLPLASLHAAGVPLVLGSDAPVTDINPWLSVQAATTMHNSGESLTPRAAFNAATRTAFRRAGRFAGEIAVGAEASFAVWSVPAFRPLAQAGGRWSADQRSGVLELPDLTMGLPDCKLTVRAGRRIFADSEWA